MIIEYEMTQDERNEEIAKFMFRVRNPYDGTTFSKGFVGLSDDGELGADCWEKLNYHSDWSEIMTIIRKMNIIKDLGSVSRFDVLV
jgi:hypothetical protein